MKKGTRKVLSPRCVESPESVPQWGGEEKGGEVKVGGEAVPDALRQWRKKRERVILPAKGREWSKQTDTKSALPEVKAAASLTPSGRRMDGER